jgi:hypothetical protein
MEGRHQEGVKKEQHDRLGRLLVSLKRQLHEEPIHRHTIDHDLLVPLGRAFLGQCQFQRVLL